MAAGIPGVNLFSQPRGTEPPLTLPPIKDLKRKLPIETPKGEYINHLLTLLEVSEIKKSSTLYEMLGKQVENLMNQKSNELTQEQQESYKWSQKLLIDDQRISSFVVTKLCEMSNTPLMVLSHSLTPSPPPTSTNPLGALLSTKASARALMDKQTESQEPLPVKNSRQKLSEEVNVIDFSTSVGQITKKEKLSENRTNSLEEKIILPSTAAACMRLAQNLSPASFQFSNGSPLTQQDLYGKAIHLDPKNAEAYRELAISLSPGGRIQLPDNTWMTKQQLCLKAIDLDPEDALAYYHLASTLPSGYIQIPNGPSMTTQDLYRKAIHLNPNFGPAYSALAETIPPGRTIKLLNKVVMTQAGLYLTALIRH